MAGCFGICATIGACGGVDFANACKVVVEWDVASAELTEHACMPSGEAVDESGKLP